MTISIYKHLFNALENPVALIGESGKIIDANQQYLSLFANDKQNIVGADIIQKFPMLNPLIISDQRQTADTDIQFATGQIRFQIESIPVPTETGERQYFIIFHQKTNYNELQEKIENLENGILDENRFSVLGHLIPGIAHNINNPLAVVIGRLQLMNIKYPGISDIAAIEDQAGLIKSIIDKLSYKASHESIEKESTVDIGELLRYEMEVLNADPFFKHKIQKTIELDVHTPLINGIYSDFSAAFLSVINYSLDSLVAANLKMFSLTLSVNKDFISVDISDTGTFSEFYNSSQSFLAVNYRSPRMGRHIVNIKNASNLIAKYNGTLALLTNTECGKEIQIRIPLKNNVPQKH